MQWMHFLRLYLRIAKLFKYHRVSSLTTKRHLPWEDWQITWRASTPKSVTLHWHSQSLKSRYECKRKRQTEQTFCRYQSLYSTLELCLPSSNSTRLLIHTSKLAIRWDSACRQCRFFPLKIKLSHYSCLSYQIQEALLGEDNKVVQSTSFYLGLLSKLINSSSPQTSTQEVQRRWLLVLILACPSLC